MAMKFAVRAANSSVHHSIGSNLIEPFPVGTPLASWGLNGWWVPLAPDTVADGEIMTIPLESVRKAITAGAPRKWVQP